MISPSPSAPPTIVPVTATLGAIDKTEKAGDKVIVEACGNFKTSTTAEIEISSVAKIS